ncbi:hypothetical protein JX265_011623 [Neoarthrinium moseri]|uniref:DUF302 domain-containing protein n=1 Tax=Neoarthrinium moseri TaxID=1658444 RepID=A0A9P9WBV1_9PEZI|nr:uncharacterized protein JN550_011926 [Neoarthrinium moseri]KAI1845514.1 hypothetical protein JX266_008372 [Neoarthrinium moseri]KAI1856376.1 hypothetical protein JX265_011623 [Neoarthrinium moseri]KAI1859618.1 hypothetical protein JN550_011926 [Neoarthrinium moseri]
MSPGRSNLTSRLEASAFRTISLNHVIIPCRWNLDSAKAALESAVPPLDLAAYKTARSSGNNAQALAALQALPTLNNFVVPPRDFGSLLSVLDQTGKAFQYEIGNPLTALSMARFELGIALYAPIRVLLRQTSLGGAVFEFDRPIDTMGQFGNSRVDKIAQDLDRDLTQVLVQAAGWKEFGDWDTRHSKL